MKLEKMNLASMQKLSRGEMKKIMAGSGTDSGVCDDWRTKSKETCYNCCITVYDYSYCATTCGY